MYNFDPDDFGIPMRQIFKSESQYLKYIQLKSNQLKKNTKIIKKNKK